MPAALCVLRGGHGDRPTMLRRLPYCGDVGGRASSQSLTLACTKSRRCKRGLYAECSLKTVFPWYNCTKANTRPDMVGRICCCHWDLSIPCRWFHVCIYLGLQLVGIYCCSGVELRPTAHHARAVVRKGSGALLFIRHPVLARPQTSHLL